MRFHRLPIAVGAAATLLFVASASAQRERAATGVGHTAESAVRPPVPGAPPRAAAFVDVTVLPMDTDRVLPHQTVLVRGGRITAIGPAATTPVSRNALRIDGRGQYLLPSLGSCHGHIVGSGFFSSSHSDPRQAQWYLFMVFASGVTTLRNVDYIDGDQPELTGLRKAHLGQWTGAWWLKAADRRRLRAQAAAGKSWSPRIYMSGQWAPLQYITGWQLRDEVRQRLPAPRLDSIAAYVAAYKAAGYDFIKLHDETTEIAESVFAAARRVGIQVGGHVRPGTYAQVLAGAQQVADHGEPHPGDVDLADTISFAADAGVRRRAGLWNCDVARPQIRPMADSGAGLLLGQDGGPGHGQFREYADSGVTPYRALAAGTKTFGQYLRTLDPHGAETGTLAVGQRADLLLLPGNPLADLRYAEISVFPADGEEYRTRRPEDSLPQVSGIMLGGRWMPGAELRRRVTVARLWRGLDLDYEQVLREGGVDTTLVPPLPQQLRQLEAVHYGQRFALLERFALTRKMPAGGADSLHGTERLVALAARQLGEVRAALPRVARARFDAQAREWLKARVAAGYHVSIAEVRP